MLPHRQKSSLSCKLRKISALSTNIEALEYMVKICPPDDCKHVMVLNTGCALQLAGCSLTADLSHCSLVHLEHNVHILTLSKGASASRLRPPPQAKSGFAAKLHSLILIN